MLHLLFESKGIYMTLNFMISALTIMLTGYMGDVYGLEFTFKLSSGLGLLAIPFAAKLDPEQC